MRSTLRFSLELPVSYTFVEIKRRSNQTSRELLVTRSQHEINAETTEFEKGPIHFLSRRLGTRLCCSVSWGATESEDHQVVGWGWFQLGNTRIISHKRFDGSTYFPIHGLLALEWNTFCWEMQNHNIPRIWLWRQQSRRIIQTIVGWGWFGIEVACTREFVWSRKHSNGFVEWFSIHALYSNPSWAFCNPRGNPRCHPLSSFWRLSTRHCSVFPTCTRKFILLFKPDLVSHSEFFSQSLKFHFEQHFSAGFQSPDCNRGWRDRDLEGGTHGDCTQCIWLVCLGFREIDVVLSGRQTNEHAMGSSKQSQRKFAK